jgi:hypothetical protein
VIKFHQAKAKPSALLTVKVKPTSAASLRHRRSDDMVVCRVLRGNMPNKSAQHSADDNVPTIHDQLGARDSLRHRIFGCNHGSDTGQRRDGRYATG